MVPAASKGWMGLRLPWVVATHVKDGSLRDHMQRVQARGAYLDMSLAMQIAIQIADALDARHLRHHLPRSRW